MRTRISILSLVVALLVTVVVAPATAAKPPKPAPTAPGITYLAGRVLPAGSYSDIEFEVEVTGVTKGELWFTTTFTTATGTIVESGGQQVWFRDSGPHVVLHGWCVHDGSTAVQVRVELYTMKGRTRQLVDTATSGTYPLPDPWVAGPLFRESCPCT